MERTAEKTLKTDDEITLHTNQIKQLQERAEKAEEALEIHIKCNDKLKQKITELESEQAELEREWLKLNVNLDDEFRSIKLSACCCFILMIAVI